MRLFYLIVLKIPLYIFCQDIAASIDEEDVAKFTDVVKEFDSMTPLVRFLSNFTPLFLTFGM